MNTFSFQLLVCSTLITVSMQVIAQPKVVHQDVELFGVKLQGANRDKLRSAFKKGGLIPIRVSDRFWADKYDPKAVLDGATSFQAGYVNKTRVFAYAEYEFQAFMKPELVTEVANMVASKYGKPDTKTGNDDVGSVVYRWNFSNGMYIRVARGWPDTKTFLTFVDPIADAQRKAEQDEVDREVAKTKAQVQSSAF